MRSGHYPLYFADEETVREIKLLAQSQPASQDQLELYKAGLDQKHTFALIVFLP